MNMLLVSKTPENTYSIVNTSGNESGVAPLPNAYTEQQLPAVLKGYGLSIKAITDRIAEVKATGNTTISW